MTFHDGYVGFSFEAHFMSKFIYTHIFLNIHGEYVQLQWSEVLFVI